MSIQHVPLSPSSRPIIWYRPMGGDARRPGEVTAWRKVVAAYHRVYSFGHLRADCRGPGSAPELDACFEYGDGLSYLTEHLLRQCLIYKVEHICE